MWFWVALGTSAIHGGIMHQTVEAAIFGAAACVIAQLQANQAASKNAAPAGKGGE